MYVSCRHWKRKLYYLFPSLYCGYVGYYKFQKGETSYTCGQGSPKLDTSFGRTFGTFSDGPSSSRPITPFGRTFGRSSDGPSSSRPIRSLGRFLNRYKRSQSSESFSRSDGQTLKLKSLTRKSRIAGFTFLKLIVAHVAAVQRWKEIIKLSFPTHTTDRHSWYSTHKTSSTERTKTQHRRQWPKSPDLTIIPFEVAVLDITETFRIS